MLPLLIIGIAQGLFAGFYFALKGPRDGVRLPVAVFLACLTLPLLLKFINYFYSADDRWSSALFAALPLTYGPLLLLYTRAVLAESPGHPVRQALHFLPFALALAIGAHYTIELPNELSRVRPPEPGLGATLPAGSPDEGTAFRLLSHVNRVWIVVFAILLSSYLGYAVAILRRLARHRRTLGEFYSSESGGVTLGWLSVTALLFLLTGLFHAVFSLLVPAIARFRGLPPGLADALSLTFFIFIFSMFSIKQPILFAKRPGLPLSPGEGGANLAVPEVAPQAPSDPAPDAPPAPNGPPRYERSGLSPEDAERHQRALEAYMARERPYRDSELTVLDVAAALGIPRHHLTQVLNEGMGVNFYNYINRLRVSEVATRLDRAMGGDTMLAVAFEAGFNSKSTFNRVFRQLTGYTPSEYRARQAARAS